MNKFILIVTALFVTSANAEYLIHIPLESQQGGFLPDNSIIMVSSSSTPTEPAPTPTEDTGCKYDIYYHSDVSTEEYLWVRSRNTTNGLYTDQIYWKTKIYENTDYSTTPIPEYILDGYKYTYQGEVRYSHTTMGSYFEEFEVCKYAN